MTIEKECKIKAGKTQRIYKTGDVLLNNSGEIIGTVKQTIHQYIVIALKDGEEVIESAYTAKNRLGYKVKEPYSQLTLFDMNRYYQDDNEQTRLL